VYERRSSATTFHRQAHYVYANAPKLQPAFFIIVPVDFEFSDRQGYQQCLPITKLNAYMQIFQSYSYLFFLSTTYLSLFPIKFTPSFHLQLNILLKIRLAAIFLPTLSGDKTPPKS